jgi:hypothetical protein
MGEGRETSVVAEPKQSVIPLHTAAITDLGLFSLHPILHAVDIRFHHT